jgi:hypothetical protein
VVGDASTSILAVTGCACGAARASVGRAFAGACPVADIVVRAVITVVAPGTALGVVGDAFTSILGVAWRACGAAWASVGCAFAGACPVADIVVRAVIAVVASGAVVGVIGDASTSILGVAWGACGTAWASVGRAFAGAYPVAYIVVRAVVTVVASGAVVGVIGDASTSILGVAWGACGTAWASVGRAFAGAYPAADIVVRAVVIVVASGAVVGVVGDASTSILGVAWCACGAAWASVGRA